MAKLGDRLEHLLVQAEDDLRLAMNEAMGSRDEQWRRISAMAGVDEEGCILPPPAGVTISDKPVAWKTTNYGAN